MDRYKITHNEFHNDSNPLVLALSTVTNHLDVVARVLVDDVAVALAKHDEQHDVQIKVELVPRS